MEDEKGAGEGVRRHAANGGKGFAARLAQRLCRSQPDAPDAVRKALKRVGSVDRNEPASSPRRRKGMGKTGKRQARAAQALLGLLETDADGRLDERGLKERLGRMAPSELQRLAKLVWLARQPAAADHPAGRQPWLDRLGDGLSGRGFALDVNGDHNAITISLGGGQRRADWERRDVDREGRYRQRFGSFSRPSWGHFLSRSVKNFIDGR